MGLQAHEQPLQRLVVLGRDRDLGQRLVVVGLPDVEAVDPVVGTVTEHVVQDPGQEPGVHQVPADLDRLADRHTRSCP